VLLVEVMRRILSLFAARCHNEQHRRGGRRQRVLRRVYDRRDRGDADDNAPMTKRQ
jgi:hypothetical protein